MYFISRSVHRGGDWGGQTVGFYSIRNQCQSNLKSAGMARCTRDNFRNVKVRWNGKVYSRQLQKCQRYQRGNQPLKIEEE